MGGLDARCSRFSFTNKLLSRPNGFVGDLILLVSSGISVSFGFVG
jgi:hypothetical protein